MPIYDQPISELIPHVIDPVVKKHIFRIIEDFNFQNVFNDNIYLKYSFTANSKTKDKHKNINTKQSRFDAETNIQLNPKNLKWEMGSFKHMPSYGIPKLQQQLDFPCFVDPSANVELYFMQVPMYLSVECTMSFLSKNMAYSAASQIFDLYGDSERVHISDIVYDCPINMRLLEKLYAIYKCRKNPKNVTFEDYLKTGSLNKIDFNINRNMDRAETVLRCSGIKMMSSIDYTGDKPSDQNQENSTNISTVQFTYHMQFLRPTQFLLRYPIVVDNKPIPIRHIITSNNTRIRNIDSTHVEKITHEYMKFCESSGYAECFVTPYYDDWREPHNTEAKKYTQRPFWIIAVTLDTDEDGNILPTTVLSLKNDIVLKFSLHPIVQEIIELQGCESYEPDCIFNITIFRNDQEYHPSELDWDVLTMSPIIKSTNYQQRFHVVISEMLDLNFLNEKWGFILEQYPDFFDGRNGNDLNNVLDNIQGESNGRGIATARVIYADIIPTRREIARRT